VAMFPPEWRGRFSKRGRGALRPHDLLQNPITFDYCTACAIPEYEDAAVGGKLLAESKLGARAWVEEHEYVVEKTIKQLALER
jgi:hypothetical protein